VTAQTWQVVGIFTGQGVILAGLILGYRQGRATHKAVNSNLTLQQERNEQLTAALTEGGVDVPRPADQK
jgi:hypothetical protein